MSAKIIWAYAHTAAILIGVVLFALGVVNEEIEVFWVGTLLFVTGFAALGRATMAENTADESDPDHA